MGRRLVGLTGRQPDLEHVRSFLKEEYGIVFDRLVNCQISNDLMIIQDDDDAIIEVICDMYILEEPVLGSLELYLVGQFDFNLEGIWEETWES